jgi:Grx4 family monothiol glutaredoxin
MAAAAVAAKPLKALASLTDFDAWVLTASEALHVLLCGAAWDEASQPGGAMDALLGALAAAHPAAHFARVDCEEVGEVAEQFSLTMVPTFLLLRGKALLERVEGPNAAEVTRRVEALAAAPAQQPAAAAAAAAAVPASLAALRARVERLVVAAPVMIFIKGTPAEPRCKFSRRLLEILKEAAVPFGSFDVLSDEAVRQDLKDLSQWPTYPQVFVGGKLVGGIDIVQELKDSGELHTVLPAGAAGAAGAAAAPPAADAAPAAAPASGPAAQARLLRLAQSAPVVLLMKGTPEAPACGFSERAVAMLRDGGVAFAPFDVLSDSGVREAAKELFAWPTFPMVLVQGKLVGGVDVLREMTEEAAAAAAAAGGGGGSGSGSSLAAQLGVEATEPLAHRLARLVRCARSVVFIKGTAGAPRCGFSSQALQLLGSAGAAVAGARDAREAAAGQPDFALGDLAYFDILEDLEVREGLKKRENWPTYPMLFHNGT